MTVSFRQTQAGAVGHAAAVDRSSPVPSSPAGVDGEVDFTELFQDHFDYVWHTLRRLGVRERDLEDSTHDVFISVHRHLGDFDPERPVRPWLFAFALRTAADYRRLARHRVDLVEDVGMLADAGPAPEAQAISRQELDLVARALDALDFDRRTLFVLHEIDGVSVPAAAELLRIPVNTAYSRLRLARADFSAAVRRLEARKRGAR
ncbi:MAG TPA: sigma-70 family RNA polymerase sigma factor [Polyangiaceae bacterium]